MSDIVEHNRVDVYEREKEVGSGDHVHRERIVEDHGARRRSALLRVTQLVWLAFGILEGLIGLRVLLKLIAANPDNPFARFVYNSTELFLQPFVGLTGIPEANGMVLEIHSIIALLVYALAGWALVRLIWLLFFKASSSRVSTYERHEH